MNPSTLNVLLVDPSLFTAPYDAALTEGLLAAGVQPTWAVRPTRKGDRSELPEAHVDAFFYKVIDEAPGLPRALRALAKGLSHAIGLLQLCRRVVVRRPAVVHFQWVVVPPLDTLAILFIRMRCPVVLTVHDTVPFNGERMSLLQNLAFDLPIKLADRVIVHTLAGRERLVKRGVAAGKLAVIPHGPLRLQATPSPAGLRRDDPRWSFVLFGEIKPYKGLDVLIEAVARLPADVRRQSRFIVAGRPRMDLAPLQARIAELKLDDAIELRPQRLSEQEMADLFAQAHAFVFPYRQIDASGVYYLVKSLGKWMIASRVGIFAEDLQHGTQGALVLPEDIGALSTALADAVIHRSMPRPLPPGSTWAGIGVTTRVLYQQAIDARSARARPPKVQPQPPAQ